MRTGEPARFLLFLLTMVRWMPADLHYSIQFNIVSKGLGSDRMSFFLNEAAGDIRDLLLPSAEPPKAKL